jgi:ABC-type oligopeptide transport system, ATPase component
MSESNGNNLLSLEDLEVHYSTGGGMLSPAKVVRAVDGVSFGIKRGETLGWSANRAAENRRWARPFCG